jgi:hypothetical protein
MTTEPVRPTQLADRGPLPTEEQGERLKARRRFNRLYVYLPLGLVAFLWLLLIVGLLWLTVAGRWFYVNTNQEYYRGLVSGVADAVTILMLAPLILLCTLPVAAAVGVAVWRRKRRKEAQTPYGVLAIFWRIDSVISRIRAGTGSLMPRLAQPIISAHAAAAYARALLQQIKNILSREINRYVD